MFLIFVAGAIAMSFGWWWRVDVRLRPMKHARLWRGLLAIFIVGTIAFPVGANRLGHYFPACLPAAGFLWHVLVAPPAFAGLAIVDGGLWVWRRSGAREGRGVDLSRRSFLTGMAAVGPPLATVGLTIAAARQLGSFGVREIDVAVDGWPGELSGFTIALVADIHTGPFVTAKMLEDIVWRTNTIHRGGGADLVVLGGDLINTTLRDLPAGLEVARALRGRLGTVAIIGNHDVMDDGARFSREVERAGIPLLRDDQMMIEAGPNTRVQLLGVDWKVGDAALFRSVAATAAKRDRDLFPICLAHHPHCWDEAVRQGLPLVLSGHTHGGQLMLTKNIGAGPLKFRYWTGVHRRAGSTLVISNGVGNWFPLRINAPAEILKLTLRPAKAEPPVYAQI